MKSYDELYKLISSSLKTTDSTLAFIKNCENYLHRSISEDEILSKYSFLKQISFVDLSSYFSKIRSSLISREKIRIGAPIIISNKLIDEIYNSLNNFSKDYVLDMYIDSTIVAGIKLTINGKVYNLSIEELYLKKT